MLGDDTVVEEDAAVVSEVVYDWKLEETKEQDQEAQEGEKKQQKREELQDNGEEQPRNRRERLGRGDEMDVETSLELLLGVNINLPIWVYTKLNPVSLRYI